MDRNDIEQIAGKAIIAVKSQYTNICSKTFSNTDRLEDLDMDSLDIMETIMCVESSLKIKIPNKQIHDIETFGDLCNLIEKNAA